ncbi:Histidine acid phosphatase family protein [Brugia malayi]|uniref:Histidine acid phosphatase family protein n=1 Tax=Brugia malayi TaxID=6279 RepID=A0A4E9FAU6_BRUMA|nr:Histidine acid phosphatase family protein [Brugia malayi]VIO93335.1 Histidine acid phosphatase family protein [Brugia malayi]
MHFEVCGIAAFHALSLILIATTVIADELIFIQIVWRHGDRAPIFTYPTDTHQEDAWPYGWGELTELGMMQQFALGQLIRQRYIEKDYNFLSQNYKPKELYIRSTDVNRTLISAMANLAGMYPTGIPGKDYPEYKQWPSHWTPIPIHTIDNEEDFVGNVFSRCPRVDQLTAIIRCSKHYRDIADENKDFFDYVSKKSGMKVNLANVHTINDIHYAEMMHNLSQPSWITDDVSKKLSNLSMITSEFIYGISEPYLPELIKLRGGSLLKLFLENINQKKECLSNPKNSSCSWILQRKYFALSAHDTTVAALLATLADEKILEESLPQYTASIAIELWNKTDVGFAVKILFHEAFHHQYRAITRFTKGCPSDSDFCPLNLFLKRSKNFLPKNIKQECLPKDEMNRSIYRLCDTETI